MYKAILADQNGSILKITLNRPDVYNAFNEDMTTELQDIFKKAHENDEIRCVVLTGAGKAFCSGQDLKDFNDKNSGFKDALDRRYNPLIKLMATLPKPIICGINGVAAGAGMSLALACDYRIAVESAQFIEVFINVGLVPDSASSFFLPRMVGYARAFEMCTTAERVSAREAKQLGLINKVVSNQAVLNVALDKVSKDYASRPTKAIGMIKSILNKSYESSLEQVLEEESINQDAAGQSEDFKEGVSSFLEKRKPVFKGK